MQCTDAFVQVGSRRHYYNYVGTSECTIAFITEVPDYSHVSKESLFVWT